MPVSTDTSAEHGVLVLQGGCLKSACQFFNVPTYFDRSSYLDVMFVSPRIACSLRIKVLKNSGAK